MRDCTLCLSLSLSVHELRGANLAQGGREVASMTQEEEVLKGEDFIREALPFFLELEEERKARESRTRVVCDYRGVNVARPPELERGVAEAIQGLESHASNLDLTAAWVRLSAGSSQQPQSSVGAGTPGLVGRSRSSSPGVSAGTPRTPADSGVDEAAGGVGVGVRRWGRGGNRDQRGGGAPGRVDVQRGVVLPGGSAGDSAAGRGEQQQQQQQQLLLLLLLLLLLKRLPTPFGGGGFGQGR